MILHQIGNSQSNYHYNAYIYHDCYWEPHFHKSFELIYVLDGTASISVNGVLDTLHTGELILLCPYTVHSLRVESSKVWVGVFSEDFVTSYSATYKQTQYAKLKCDPESANFLRKHLFIQGTPDRFLCISCLYLICHMCSENAALHNCRQNNKFVSDVISYVSQNINEDITLKDIAKVMNYEYHYFSSLFHQAFSLNFKSFINLLRIENACTILTDSNNSITNVCEACGFTSIRNFNRVFKTVCGCTPQEYRKVHCKR
ncbi:MAG: AraC family transcriptional regulator [Ruminococcaceae bacterium]|nr:AraC family transcriptional regulator [Oscillospiraceae bacterium]